MNESIYIKHGMIYANDVMVYPFKILPFNNLNSTQAELEIFSESLSKILRKLNMPGGIICLPLGFDKQAAEEWYDNEFETYGFKDLRHVHEIFKKDMLNNHQTKIVRRYYLYFCDGRDEVKKSNFNVLKDILEIFNLDQDTNANRVLNACRGNLESIYSTICEEYSGVSKMEKHEIYELNRMLDLPKLNSHIQYRDLVDLPKNTYMQHEYYDENNLETVEWNSKIVTISKIDKDVNIATKGLASAVYNYPCQFHIKWDFEHSKDLERKIEVQKNLIIDDNIKHRKNFWHKDKEMEKNEKSAKKIHKLVELSEGDDFFIRFQIYFRFFGKNLKVIEKGVNSISKNLGKSFVVDTMTSRQDIAQLNFLPWQQTIASNIIKTNLMFYTNLNPLGSHYAGSEQGHLLYKLVEGNEVIAIDQNAIRRQEVTEDATVRFICGTTGSGKSMFSITDMFTRMVHSGHKIIFIYPKADALNLGKNMHYLKNDITITRLGDSDSDKINKGSLDPFLVFRDDSLRIKKCKELIKQLADSYKINHNEIEIDYIIKALRERSIPLNMTNITSVLCNSKDLNNKKLGDTLLSQSPGNLMSLFFADNNTKTALNLNAKFDLIQLVDIPKIEVFDKMIVDHILINTLFEYITEVIETTITRLPRSSIVVDELKKLSAYPRGKQWPDDLARVVRSSNAFLDLLTQNATDVTLDVLNNVGQVAIGKLKSASEIDYICEHLSLNDTYKTHLKKLSNLTDKNVKSNIRYSFVYKDYNNNVAKVKLNTFSKELFDDFNDKME